MVYVSRRMDFLLKSSVATFAFIFILIATTSLGVPYKWSDDGLPRLRRILALVRYAYVFYIRFLAFQTISVQL